MRREGDLPFVGIDLTAGKRPTDVAALNQEGTAVRFGSVVADDEIMALVARLGARIVAIDSPMGFPTGLCCLEEGCSCVPLSTGTGRSAERELAARGIPCFWTTKRTIIKSMIYRAVELKERLDARGTTVLEVYPYAVKRVLLGRDLPRKNSPAGIGRLIEGARQLLPDCAWPTDWFPSHDQLDALFCAITARLHSIGQTEDLGDPAEIPIVVPVPSAAVTAGKALKGH